jgi:maltose alpha-D-glucosyltransferase/alpha-amylase
MLRSFDYAGFEGPEHWAAWSAAAFLRPYLARAGGWGLLPRNPEDLRRTLDAFRMEKALYELSYERSRRPSWARIPMRGILDMLDNPGRRACFSQG